ncbi:MAG: hydantoinase/oxoprolinase family protein [Proteobacteria bacterium]|nr:hydantoinase/oxoprolinase family protein [Pseudomonadota bacterium]
MAKFLGVDTGGTFTDFILFDDATGSITTHKVLSTPHAPELAILQGISELSITGGGFSVIHGSTVATNAILEGKGVPVAYITNRGLADVLNIGRQAREELYNLTPLKKPPLIDPEFCLEVDSRLSAQGEHLQQLDEPALTRLKQQLVALAPEAVAINLLFSFFDDSEELKIEQAVEELFADDVFISRSSDVLPEYKEYERGMTTVLNAKVGPLMQGYLRRLEDGLQGSSLSIMQSSGGVTSAEQAGFYPVNLLLSGPAGGLKGAQTVARASGIEQLLSFDMGGTSTDVSIIDREIGFTTGAKIGGYPVAVPMVDMFTIGAGGGSIARVDAGGLLLVGPESAGATPGPACYGSGGQRPTVTDANVVLCRLLPQAFLGGNMRLDKDAAHSAVQTIADDLSSGENTVTVEQAAQGIIDVVNDHMARALRVMSVERGEDPKDFTLVSFGGAGGLHVCALAEELEMDRAMVPVNAGVLSAVGMLAADASRERSRTVNRCLGECDEEGIGLIFDELVSHARDELGSTTITDSSGKDEIKIVLTVDVRYQGQSNTLNLPWSDLMSIAPAFHQKHEDSYGHRLDIDIELVNVRVRVTAPRQAFTIPRWQPTEELQEVPTSMPGVEGSVAVINRAAMKTGQQFTGPLLITETSSTTWLATGWCVKVDDLGNLHLSKV